MKLCTFGIAIIIDCFYIDRFAKGIKKTCSWVFPNLLWVSICITTDNGLCYFSSNFFFHALLRTKHFGFLKPFRGKVSTQIKNFAHGIQSI